MKEKRKEKKIEAFRISPPKREGGSSVVSYLTHFPKKKRGGGVQKYFNIIKKRSAGGILEPESSKFVDPSVHSHRSSTGFDIPQGAARAVTGSYGGRPLYKHGTVQWFYRWQSAHSSTLAPLYLVKYWYV